MFANIKDSIRQYAFYPRDFRIPTPKWPDLSESLDGIVDLLKSSSSSKTYRSETEDELLDMAVDIGTLVWRIQQRLENSAELPTELRRISRDLESTWDSLTQRGIEIKDHTGQDYRPGMALQVITSQPVAGLTKQTVIETLKPTIYHREKIVQMGQVVIGVPEEIEILKTDEETTQ
jgi:hypothetical protein